MSGLFIIQEFNLPRPRGFVSATIPPYDDFSDISPDSFGIKGAEISST